MKMGEHRLEERLARDLEPNLVMVLQHPVRRQILRALLEGERTWSPAELSRAGKVSCRVPCTNYHMRALEGQGLVRHASSQPGRGAVKHSFSPAVKGEGPILTVLRETKRADTRLLTTPGS